MDLSRFNIDAASLPHGLKSQLDAIFASSPATDPKLVMNLARELLERMLHHLKTIAGYDLREMHSLIDKLDSGGVIDHEVTPYFHFWWSISCLGSHYQPSTSPWNNWKNHLDICRSCIETCIAWYYGKYPPLDLTDEERTTWLKDVSTLYAVPYDDIQICNDTVLSGFRNHDNVLFLTGRSWVGKTSIACRVVTEFVRQGYVPLVIHENSLVTFRVLNPVNKDHPKTTRLAANAQAIHEIVASRLLHGESFIVFLDDPFGHRRFQHHNPLMYLRISDWLNLASKPHAFGKLKVIITSPLVFLTDARSSLADNARTNPIAAANTVLLNEATTVKLDVSAYTRPQVAEIVRSAARSHNCLWAHDRSRCDVVADAIVDANAGFDSLHVLCRDLKSATDDYFLDRVISVTCSADVAESIRESSEFIRSQLSAALIGESLIEFYREFRFQTTLHFRDVLQAVNATIEGDSHEMGTSQEFSEWLLADRVSTLNLVDFPVFSHPEVRHAVSALAESEFRERLREGVVNLCGLEESYQGTVLARWEATHLLCRMSRLIREEEVDVVQSRHFVARLAQGGDPRNALWAIVNNWNHIVGTPLHRVAMGFLKAVPHNYPSLIRPLIWEAVENWTQLDESVRALVVKNSGNFGEKGEWRAQPNDHTTLAFVAAGIVHYGSLQETARAGCEASDRYLDGINVFVTQIKRLVNQSYTSRIGDGLFEAPGNRYTGAEVCKRLYEVGLRCGSLTPTHPLAQMLMR